MRCISAKISRLVLEMIRFLKVGRVGSYSLVGRVVTLNPIQIQYHEIKSTQIWCDTIQYSTMQCDTMRYDTMRYGNGTFKFEPEKIQKTALGVVLVGSLPEIHLYHSLLFHTHPY